MQPVLETIDEIRNPLGGIDPTMEHVKHLGDAMVVLRARAIKAGKPLADALYQEVKSAKFRNAITPETFDMATDAMVRVHEATANRVSPREFMQVEKIKMMKGSLPGISDEFLYKYAPELAQEFGRSSGGTYFASLYQEIVSGQMRTSGLKELNDLGLIDDSKAEFSKNGRIVRVKPGAYLLCPAFENDPMTAMDQLVDAMNAHGITDPDKQRDEFSVIFGNRNAWIGEVLHYSVSAFTAARLASARPCPSTRRRKSSSKTIRRRR